MNAATILDLFTRYAAQIAGYLFGPVVDGITNDHLGL